MVGADDLRGLARPAGQPALSRASRNSLRSTHQTSSPGIEEVTAVAVQDGVGTVSQPVKGVAQAVERDVEVVAGGSWLWLGHCSSISTSRRVGRSWWISRYWDTLPGFQAVPFRDSPPGHVYRSGPSAQVAMSAMGLFGFGKPVYDRTARAAMWFARLRLVLLFPWVVAGPRSGGRSHEGG